MTGAPSGLMIVNVNVTGVSAATVMVAGTSVNPDCEADSPSPEGIGSVVPGIPGIAGVVETGNVPGVLIAVRLEVLVLQAARSTDTVTTMAAATKLPREMSAVFMTAAYLPRRGMNRRMITSDHRLLLGVTYSRAPNIKAVPAAVNA